LDSELAREYGGTGLGLFLVKKLVEIQGGHIEVQSEIGEGSFLPLFCHGKPLKKPTCLCKNIDRR
jgi:signal transduction histidine kinase